MKKRKVNAMQVIPAKEKKLVYCTINVDTNSEKSIQKALEQLSAVQSVIIQQGHVPISLIPNILIWREDPKFPEETEAWARFINYKVMENADYLCYIPSALPFNLNGVCQFAKWDKELWVEMGKPVDNIISMLDLKYTLEEENFRIILNMD